MAIHYVKISSLIFAHPRLLSSSTAPFYLSEGHTVKGKSSTRIGNLDCGEKGPSQHSDNSNNQKLWSYDNVSMNKP